MKGLWGGGGAPRQVLGLGRTTRHWQERTKGRRRSQLPGVPQAGPLATKHRLPRAWGAPRLEKPQCEPPTPRKNLTSSPMASVGLTAGLTHGPLPPNHGKNRRPRGSWLLWGCCCVPGGVAKYFVVP